MKANSIWLYIGMCWVLGEEVYVNQQMLSDSAEYADLRDSEFGWYELDECSNC